MVKVFDDFDEEGSTKQFVILEERGRVEYTEFVKIVGKYVEFAKEFIPDYDGTDLYPYLKQKMSSIALLLFYKPIRISLN